MEREQKKENTPPSRAKMLIAEEMQHPLTPTGNKDGVKGILRPSGTPGSGNGGEPSAIDGFKRVAGAKGSTLLP
jgi:hypothetical protein